MELLGANPGRRIMVYFLAGILAGTVNTHEHPISVIDALFTATSAVCVTGLTVVDTGRDFSTYGQVVILILIQLGGLGIMTFATSLLLMMGSKVSFQDRLGLTQSFAAGPRVRSGSLMKAVVITTLMFEAVGAVLLFLQFRHTYPLGQAWFQAIFHSVSAFCNAGFSTYSNSLEGYAGNIPIIFTFAGLIIFGGLGFVVIRELVDRARYKTTRLSLHTKLCLTTTVVLLLGGTVVFYISEAGNVFRDSTFAESLANAFFQSVTARTAGFNTITQSNLTEVSLLFTMILMFIGASPGSTGGGIKTTTFAALGLLLYHRFWGRQSVVAFKRSISGDSIVRAQTVVLLAVMVIVLMLALLMFTEDRPLAHTMSHGWFVGNIFEMVSAFGTVGLSLGLTGHVTIPGKLVLILTMFIGRVGLLTLAYGLARAVRRGEVTYLEENVMVG